MSATSEIMMLADIEAQHGSVWVLLADPIHDANDNITGGTVLCISENPEDLDRVLSEQHARHFAYLHLGPTPENIFLNL